ncbi:MAG: FG-GAP repeat protein [Hellea sp.]
MMAITNWFLKHKSFTSPTIVFYVAIILTACVSTPVSQKKLIAEDGASDDFFGYSVALSDEVAVIGSFKDDDPLLGDDAGSAYVFARSGKVWRQQAKLTAIDGAPNDTFGGNVAVSGNTIVVGSMRDDDRGENSGSAYIFTRSNNIWNHQTKILAADGAKGNAFGQSVAISGNTLIVGSPRDDVSGEDTGSVYVFSRDGEFWQQQAKLTADDGADGDLFGISVALSDDTILVGADLHDEIAPDAGAVYVYARSGDKWSQQAKLTAADGKETDIFGVRVALSGDTALISARRDDDDVMGVDAGSAYVFVRSGTTWSQQQKLTAPDGAGDDRFGRSVALLGDTVLVGAMFQDDKGENSGSVYWFERHDQRWRLKTKLTAGDAAENDVFGWSLAISPDAAIVGASRNDDNGNESGSAYIFDIRD